MEKLFRKCTDTSVLPQFSMIFYVIDFFGRVCDIEVYTKLDMGKALSMLVLIVLVDSFFIIINHIDVILLDCL